MEQTKPNLVRQIAENQEGIQGLSEALVLLLVTNFEQLL